MEENKRKLERETRQLAEQYEKDILSLENEAKRYEQLEQDLEVLYHDIYQKNNQIQAIESEEKEGQIDDVQKAMEEQELKAEQQEQLFKTKFQKTLEKSRSLVEQFYSESFKLITERSAPPLPKLDVQSVKIMFLKNDPSEFLEKNSRNSMTLSFIVQTFSINKQTLLGEVFDTALDYFQISIAKKDDHVLTDTNFNDLTLLYNFTAGSYFAQQKETTLYAELYLKPKFIYQSVLLDRQQSSIQLGEFQDIQTSYDTEKKNLVTVFANFEKVFSGISLYSSAIKDNSSKLIQQKFKSRPLLKLLHVLVSLAVISLLIGRLNDKDGAFAQTLKANSQNSLQTFLYASEPMQDSNLFLRGMNSFSRVIKYQKGSTPSYNALLNRNDFITIGAVRVVLKKAIQVPCLTIEEYSLDSSDIDPTCFEPIINDSTEYKEVYGGVAWSSHEDTTFDPVQGYFETYSGGGYIKDVNPYISDATIYQNEIANLNSQLNEGNRVIMIYNLLYDLNSKYFYSTYYLAEKSSSGIYIENQNVKYFSLKYSSLFTSQDSAMQVLSIACIILISIQLLISLVLNIDRAVQIFKLNKSEKLQMSKLKIFMNLISFQALIEIVIVILIVISYVYIYDLPPQSLSEIISTQYPSFINLHKYGVQQELGYNLLAISVVALVVLLCLNIPLNQAILQFQRMLQNSTGIFIVLLILSLVTVCSVALIFQRIYGRFIYEFSSFGMALYQTIFLYFFGDYNIQQKMWKQSKIIAYLFSLVMIIGIFFGVVSLFTSVIYEKFRIVNTKSNPTKEKQDDVANQLNDQLQNIKSRALSCYGCLKKNAQNATKTSSKSKGNPSNTNKNIQLSEIKSK